MRTPPQLLSSHAALIKWFREQSTTAANAYELGMGVRALEIGGFVRDLSAVAVASFWRKCVKALPDDAAFLQWADSAFVIQAVSSGGYSDAYLVMLGSKEWPKVEDGQVIPVMHIIADENGDTRIELK